MNKRIHELTVQTDIWCDQNWFGQDLPLYNQKWEEKFAELIVRECISICKEKERANLYGVREVEATIKEHFGVE